MSRHANPTGTKATRIAIIGAGIGGLAAALRLSATGAEIVVFERAKTVGGKIRTLPSAAGPVAAGPTVLTLKPVFDALFASIGERIEDHVTLTQQPILARHFWPDGAQLDLFADHAASRAAIAEFSGSADARAFETFNSKTRALFEAFEAPMMQAPAPRIGSIVLNTLRAPALLPWLFPWKSLSNLLDETFSDPRLRQLFGRYATYVGGSPYASPALLGLIWQAEARGVWTIKGGICALAQAISALCKARGVQFALNTHISKVHSDNKGVIGVETSNGTREPYDLVIFNGDPKALGEGLLGPDVSKAAPKKNGTGRSLSAQVWAFAASVSGPELAHHNVFFNDNPRPEFAALERNEHPRHTPTIYLCAQDRGAGVTPPKQERFEMILNAPAIVGMGQPSEEFHRCLKRSFHTLENFKLRFDPHPQASSLTTPGEFQRLFPGSGGALYGQSPHGMTAALKRPRARTKMKGLYLVGGGTHPGAGVPMATLSAAHAVEMIKRDQTLTSPSRPMVTRGGMSTA